MGGQRPPGLARGIAPMLDSPGMCVSVIRSSRFSRRHPGLRLLALLRR